MKNSTLFLFFNIAARDSSQPVFLVLASMHNAVSARFSVYTHTAYLLSWRYLDRSVSVASFLFELFQYIPSFEAYVITAG